MSCNSDQSVQSVIKSTDVFLEKSSHFYSKFLSDYSQPWAPESDRKCGRGWGRGGKWHHNKLGKHPEAVGYIDANGNWDLGNGQVIELDKTKQTNLWAFPVPSSTQDQRCRDLGGIGVWTRESVWRCLFPVNKHHLENELEKSKNNKPESRLFGDYTEYLDWKATMRKLTYNYNQKSEKTDQSTDVQTLCDFNNNWNEKDVWYQDQPKNPNVNQTLLDDENVISSVRSTETFKRSDGTLATKLIVKNEYADGSTTTTERITSKDKQAGWFWK